MLAKSGRAGTPGSEIMFHPCESGRVYGFKPVMSLHSSCGQQPNGSIAPCVRRSYLIGIWLLEFLVEGDLAGDRDLVGGDAALEEVGELLHVLQFHERERVAGAEVGG